MRIVPWGVAAVCRSWGPGPGGALTLSSRAAPEGLPREGPQQGQGSWPSVAGQQTLRSGTVKDALGGVVTQGGHTEGLSLHLDHPGGSGR